MVGEGGKGSTQAVGTNLWKPCLSASSVGRIVNRVGVACNSIFRFLISGIHRSAELGNQEGDGSTAGGVLVFFSVDEGAVFIMDGGSSDINTPGIQSKYFQKGSMIIVSGRLQIRSWTDKDGNKHRTAEVVADNVYFGDSKKQDTYTGFAPNDSVPTPSASAQDYALLGDDTPLPWE